MTCCTLIYSNTALLCLNVQGVGKQSLNESTYSPVLTGKVSDRWSALIWLCDLPVTTYCRTNRSIIFLPYMFKRISFSYWQTRAIEVQHLECDCQRDRVNSTVYREVFADIWHQNSTHWTQHHQQWSVVHCV